MHGPVRLSSVGWPDGPTMPYRQGRRSPRKTARKMGAIARLAPTDIVTAMPRRVAAVTLVDRIEP